MTKRLFGKKKHKSYSSLQNLKRDNTLNINGKWEAEICRVTEAVQGQTTSTSAGVAGVHRVLQAVFPDEENIF